MTTGSGANVRLAIIDHELCFYRDLCWSPPWETAGFRNYARYGQHIFGKPYNKTPPELDDFVGAWQQLEVARIKGEFFTVGVAVFEPDSRFLRFKFLHQLDAAAQLLGKDATQAFSGMIAGVHNIAEQIQQRVTTELPQSHALTSLEACLQELLPPDDSALQWTETQYGLSTDLEATANHLFKRYCQRFDLLKSKPGPEKQRRTVADVSRRLRKELAMRHLDS